MNLLAIETSGPALSIAVKKGKNKVREVSLRGHFRHVENLIPLIDRLLKKEKLKIKDVGVFLISCGPGSFTGLRVGFATLKGFLSVRQRPCFGALSFDLVAATIPSKKGRTLAVCLNAKRDKLYVRSYRYHEERWKALGTPSAVAPEVWIKQLPEETLIVGNGLESCLRGQTLIDCLSPKTTVFSKKYWELRASALISLYERKDPLLKRLKRPKDILPVYLRASEAEERLKK